MTPIELNARRGLYLVAVKVEQERKVRGAATIALGALYQPARSDVDRNKFSTVFHRKADVVRVRDLDIDGGGHQRQLQRSGKMKTAIGVSGPTTVLLCNTHVTRSDPIYRRLS